MDKIVKFNQVEDKVLNLRGQNVILDRDVAALYGVETRDVNKAVKNNPHKFPEGYILELDKTEKNELVENFHRFDKLKHSTVFPSAFTEKGLYMLATILKSPKAAQTTIEIVEAFANMRELSRTVAQLTKTADKEQQNSLMKRGGELISDILGNEMQTESSELSFELNLAFLKVKGAVKQKRKE
ncbi:hypothetical protein FACS189467_1850 [Bacteroidia bacterium]|nr:hypothetical protein FACS189467_1850 [Bacteroidia bacterium]